MNIDKRSKRISASILTALFVSMNTSVSASEITGVNGNNGVYNINPSAVITNHKDIGYRKYKDFNLDKGDIANLIFKYGNNDINSFVNLVDNQININGLVNSMRDGKFYNGNAIFISPNGMIIGPSGVINVGSLSISTPTQDKYNLYKNNPSADFSGLYDTNNNSVVSVNGLIITAKDVDIQSGRIDVANGANILAGTKNKTLVNTNSEADNLFNTLVNTSNIHEAENLGNITINSTIGTNVIGNIKSNGNGTVTINNTGNDGIYIDSTGRINGNNVVLNNIGTNGTNIKGLIKAEKDIKINNKNSNVVIGDNTNNNYYVQAGNDIDINIEDGSLLNYGVNKVLLAADGDLTMRVINGTIGLPVQQDACQGSGCVGVGDKADGSRDFTKSINGNIKGKVNATTTNTKAATKPDDLVINYAAIDSDMNIDQIKADGRVILTVDDSAHAFNGQANGKRYNMINASTDSSKANVEGWGISLISNGNIGEKDNKLTFNQINAPEYAMDVLANENIYMKALDDEKNVTNEVCNIISREGDVDIEFGGNTHIKNITAEGDMKVITRGTNLTIDNLGHIDDPSLVKDGKYNDYFGPSHDGYEFDGGYDKDDYKHEILPNNVTVKALDINPYTRPDGIDRDGYRGDANSTVRITNAVIDNGTLDITADQIYANGIHVDFGKDGFVKEVDPSTNPVQGVVVEDGPNIPTGHAVRPEDVQDIDRDEHERNYYYHDGDGDGTFDGEPSNVDPDDGIVDATPLDMPDADDDTDVDIDTDTDIDIDLDSDIDTDSDSDIDTDLDIDIDADNDTDDDINPPDGSSSYIQRKLVDNNIDTIDKRQYMRFNVSEITKPVTMEKTNNGINSLIDISRGGIAVKHDNNLKVGDVLPVHIQYKDLDINTNVKVVSATKNRAGAEFVNLDKAIANQLLYLNILLEADNNMLVTSFKG